MGQHLAPGIDGRDGSVLRHAETQPLDHAGQRRGRAHGHAMPGRAAHAGLGGHEVLDRHAPAAHLLRELPYMGARAQGLTTEAAVQHRPAGDRQCREIAARRPHHQRWGGLVAADQQHHAVDRVAADGFFDIHAGQVAEQHGGRAQVVLAAGEHRELNWKAAGLPHAAFDRFGQVAEMRIARIEL